MLFETLEELQECDKRRMSMYRRELAMQLTASSFNACIDHTLLDESPVEQVDVVVDEAVKRGMQICTDYTRLVRAYKRKQEKANKKSPLISVVCDFPRGKGSGKKKLDEAKKILEEADPKGGAHRRIVDELDLVANADLYLKRKSAQYVQEIKDVADWVHVYWKEQEKPTPLLKVIIQAWRLKDPEIITTVSTCIAALSKEYRYLKNGKEYPMPIGIKNSTGFHPGYDLKDCAATPEHIWLMRNGAGDYSDDNPVLIKAAGSIRTVDSALDMMLAGGLVNRSLELIVKPREAYRVVRVGASKGAKIADDFRKKYQK